MPLLIEVCAATHAVSPLTGSGPFLSFPFFSFFALFPIHNITTAHTAQAHAIHDRMAISREAICITIFLDPSLHLRRADSTTHEVRGSTLGAAQVVT